MRRKATPTTRGPNTAEKAFQAFTKQSDCIVCGCPGPSISDHCYGSTCKQDKVLIGHWWQNPLCEVCDRIKTGGSTKGFIIKYGRQLKEFWKLHIANYTRVTGKTCPDEVYGAIHHYREYVP